jgi:hypothetical protein
MFNLFKREYPSKIYTYFIPAPAQMIRGYREKQADKMINEILKHGFKLHSLKTESISTEKIRGMWLIVHLKPMHKTAAELDLNKLIDEIEQQSSLDQEDATIDGLYQLG